MTIRYSDMPEQPRPCRFCGTDTAPGQPGHDGSQAEFDEEPCERHFEIGVFAEAECPDCRQDPWYICGSCTGEMGIGGAPVIEPSGGSEGPIH